MLETADLVFAAAAALCAFAGIQVERWRTRMAWRARSAGRRGPARGKVTPILRRVDWAQGGPPPRTKASDAADQLRLVMDSDFSRRPLMSKSEARIFEACEKLIAERGL